MLYFFSNHSNTEFLENYFNDRVEVIPHPYIEPDWSTKDIWEHCSDVIQKAIEAEKLIINGDYTLFAIILLERHRAGKPTGFICMRKIEGEAIVDSDGKIVHRNIIKPVNVRWISWGKPYEGFSRAFKNREGGDFPSLSLPKNYITRLIRSTYENF